MNILECVQFHPRQKTTHIYIYIYIYNYVYNMGIIYIIYTRVCIYIYDRVPFLSEQLLDHSTITVNRIDSADKHWKYESSRQKTISMNTFQILFAASACHPLYTGNQRTRIQNTVSVATSRLQHPNDLHDNCSTGNLLSANSTSHFAKKKKHLLSRWRFQPIKKILVKLDHWPKQEIKTRIFETST